MGLFFIKDKFKCISSSPHEKKVFLKPMMESGVVKSEDVDTIFVNWKDLIACNNTFLRY